MTNWNKNALDYGIPEETSGAPDLFQKVDFISHAGIPLSWKIECDAIKPQEWNCFATMIMDYQTEPFSKVVGIPRGGLPLQYALEPYVTNGRSSMVSCR